MSAELSLSRQLSPEEIELKKKERVLERLKDRLAFKEEDMADLRGELERFEAQYSMQVGRLYAEIDEIEAAIAEEELKLVPDDEEIKKRVEELRRKAEESAARAAAAEAAEKGDWKPTAEAKKAYHDLARTIHPDLAVDSEEKERRHMLMAELNKAYSSGDQEKLDRLADDLRHSPALVPGDSFGDRLVRVIRQIAQVKARFTELAEEGRSARASETYALFLKAKAEREEGRDMIAQIAARTAVHIMRANRRLQSLRTVNTAAKAYVQETFGMNIEDFRETASNKGHKKPVDKER
ncbi:MAG: hypothetical protein UZ17_ACD001002782 [Acidobacteria bacterium OLB17]|nr:MAG: hypothetical protein UZ17_ACD001002782 [Acidobacteria bacterium OLB17]MCZ2390410.1 J domain-containing protein [Acidobacteriota bacterium]